MNHARNRAREIERQMLRPPQRRDRIVRPVEPTLATSRDDGYHKCECGYAMCCCARLAPPKHAAWTAHEEVKRLSDAALRAVMLPASAVKPPCSERCSPNIHLAGCPAYAYEVARAPASGRVTDIKPFTREYDCVIRHELAPGWAEDRYLGGTQYVHKSARVWAACNRWYYKQGSGHGVPDEIRGVETRDEAMARALGWFPEGASSWFFKKTDRTGRMQVESAKGFFSAFRGCPTWAERHGLASLPHAVAWCRGEG